MRVVLTAFAACLAVALSAAPGAAEPPRFASAIEDLPLMPELVEEAVAPFETPEGRIVRVETTGRVRPEAVASFYQNTLPALGWRRSDERDALAFTRAGERLALTIETSPGAGTAERAGGATRVTFVLTPAGSPAL